MTYEIYRYIFIGAAVLCGIMLVVAVLLFILLKIPAVIGDLSGSTARKAIQNIREQNEKSGDNKTSPYNRERGRNTDKMSNSGRAPRQNQAPMSGPQTNKMNTAAYSGAPASNETTALGNETTNLSQPTGQLNSETTVLTQPTGQLNSETTVLTQPIGQLNSETTVLTQPTGQLNSETTILSQYAMPASGGAPTDILSGGVSETTVLSGSSGASFDPMFTIEYDITFIHTNEIIA